MNLTLTLALTLTLVLSFALTLSLILSLTQRQHVLRCSVSSSSELLSLLRPCPTQLIYSCFVALPGVSLGQPEQEEPSKALNHGSLRRPQRDSACSAHRGAELIQDQEAQVVLTSASKLFQDAARQIPENFIFSVKEPREVRTTLGPEQLQPSPRGVAQTPYCEGVPRLSYHQHTLSLGLRLIGHEPTTLCF